MTAVDKVLGNTELKEYTRNDSKNLKLHTNIENTWKIYKIQLQYTKYWKTLWCTTDCAATGNIATRQRYSILYFILILLLTLLQKKKYTQQMAGVSAKLAKPIFSN